jgi:ribosomal protein L22
MPQKAKDKPVQRAVDIDPRKLRELCRLLKVKTEEEAIRIAVEESLQNRRAARSLNRFLDALAHEQTSPQS